ncbi:hypothetical protein ACN47E_008896 [Coniothyrium glycines]
MAHSSINTTQPEDQARDHDQQPAGLDDASSNMATSGSDSGSEASDSEQHRVQGRSCLTYGPMATKVPRQRTRHRPNQRRKRTLEIDYAVTGDIQICHVETGHESLQRSRDYDFAESADDEALFDKAEAHLPGLGVLCEDFYLVQLLDTHRLPRKPCR